MSEPGKVVVLLHPSTPISDVEMPSGIERSLEGALPVRPGATLTITPAEKRVLAEAGIKFRVLAEPKAEKEEPPALPPKQVPVRAEKSKGKAEASKAPAPSDGGAAAAQ